MRFLMVGLGGIGQRHVRNLRALFGPNVEILAYRVRCTSTVLTDQLEVEQGVGLEEKYGIVTYTDLGRALAQEPDAAFVCNPSSLHIPVSSRIAEAGCHLFIEKPLSHSYEGVEEFLRLVDRRNLKAVVGYQMRFHPCLRRVHALLREGAIGQVVAVRAEVGEYLPGWHAYEDYRQMYASRQDLGGGVILSQIHELDYLYWFFGFPRRVFALGGHLSRLEVDVEDTADILMDMVVEGRPVPVNLHQDYVQRPPSRSCTIVGDAGKVVVDLRALKVDVYDEAGSQVEASSFEGFQRNQLFLDELEQFVQYLKGGPTSLVGAHEAAKSLRIALAAKESLATGNVVTLARSTP